MDECYVSVEGSRLAALAAADTLGRLQLLDLTDTGVRAGQVATLRAVFGDRLRV